MITTGTGTCFIISAPSGAGKSSLIKELLNRCSLNNIKLSISHTTRTMRSGEKNGKNYHFISTKEFKNMIKKDFFLEYAKVFDNYYGTSKILIEKYILLGLDILLDINWEGAKKIRNYVPKSKSIFILPPSKQELLRRLKNRSQNTLDEIYQRMKGAVSDVKHCREYDIIIVNDDLKDTVLEVEKIIKLERLNINYIQKNYSVLIQSLILN